jgi:hypothetical protein
VSDSTEYVGPVKVTVTRPDTGEVLKERVISDDYMLICNGTRYLKSYQIWGRTHQLNVAVGKPESQS